MGAMSHRVLTTINNLDIHAFASFHLDTETDFEIILPAPDAPARARRATLGSRTSSWVQDYFLFFDFPGLFYTFFAYSARNYQCFQKLA